MNSEEIQQIIIDLQSNYVSIDLELTQLKHKKQKTLETIYYWQSELQKEVKKEEDEVQ